MGKGHAHKPGGTNVREISNPSGGGGNVRNDGEAKQTRDNTGGFVTEENTHKGRVVWGVAGFFVFVKETFCEFKKKKKNKRKKNADLALVSIGNTRLVKHERMIMKCVDRSKGLKKKKPRELIKKFSVNFLRRVGEKGDPKLIVLLSNQSTSFVYFLFCFFLDCSTKSGRRGYEMIGRVCGQW